MNSKVNLKRRVNGGGFWKLQEKSHRTFRSCDRLLDHFFYYIFHLLTYALALAPNMLHVLAHSNNLYYTWSKWKWWRDSFVLSRKYSHKSQHGSICFFFTTPHLFSLFFSLLKLLSPTIRFWFLALYFFSLSIVFGQVTAR